MSARPASDVSRPCVLVLGGGFGGIGAAKNLRKSDADVVLVDKHDYHTFQPLLYQVATGLLEQPAVGHPIRDLFHKQDNIRVHQDEVTAIDLDAREVRFGELEALGYDYLVLALGAEVNFFGVEGAAEHAFPLYTLADAVRLKDHVLERWEAADRNPELIEDGALNMVVVGGGPTGVETAGAMAELYNGVFRKDYPDVSPEQARIVLVEASPEIFSMFKEDIRSYADGGAREARRRGHDRRGRRRRSRLSGSRSSREPSFPPTRSSGVQACRGTSSSVPSGSSSSGATGSASTSELRLTSHPEVYVIGDIAAITDPKTEQVLPQLGSVALQSGEHAGETIARLVAGKETKPFEYKDKGTMATIGRGAAVVQMLGGKTMKGKKAQVAWGTVHLALLPTNEDRAKAVVDWAGAGLTHQRSGRIRVET